MARNIFPGFSSNINLRRLEQESRRRLFCGFVFATAMLALLAVFRPSLIQKSHPSPEEPYRTIRTDIIEVPSVNMSEPFRLQARSTSRAMVFRRKFAPARPSAMPGRKPAEIPKIEQPSFLKELDHEAGRLAGRFSVTLNVDGALPRGPDDSIPLRLNVGRDPGMFRASIIYNPQDKMAAQGYVHIPLVRFGNMEQTELFVRSLRGLAAGINRYTNIRAVFDAPLSPLKFPKGIWEIVPIKEAVNERGIGVDSLSLFRPPLVYLLVDRAFDLNRVERESIRRYIDYVGVLFIESARPGDEELRRKIRGLMQTLFDFKVDENLVLFNDKLSAGFDPIPVSHPLFHCFYDFERIPDGAPPELGSVPHRVTPYIEGVWHRGRLIALYSDRGYGLCWAEEKGYEEQKKLGVNLVLYALIQQKARQGHLAVGEK
ncbi:MAG: DUF4159 domain-containing protein [Candidatus Latescibacterota bacterium]